MKAPLLLLLTTMFYASLCGIEGTRVVAEDQIARNVEGASAEDPFVTGQFSWVASPPLIGPVDHGDDHCNSIKDPTIVRHDGRWHLFTTLRSEKRSHQIEYMSFTDWKDANQAERHLIDLTEGYHCAPQVFFFSPQQKWYMIHQIQEPTRKPSLQPAFSTSDDINNPRSWSKSKLLPDMTSGFRSIRTTRNCCIRAWRRIQNCTKTMARYRGSWVC